MWFTGYHDTMTLGENFQIWNKMHEISDPSEPLLKCLRLWLWCWWGWQCSDKPKRSRRSSKAIKEDKEFEIETKKYLYMAPVEDVKSEKIFFWLNLHLRDKLCWWILWKMKINFAENICTLCTVLYCTLNWFARIKEYIAIIKKDCRNWRCTVLCSELVCNN